MERVGLDPSAIPSAARTDIDAFLELHIEQGRVLQDHGLDIGLVDVIPGLAWETVRVVGRQDHAGATPMDLRADALQAAAEICRRATTLVESWGRPAVVTMGRWSVKPGWPSIVPGTAEFSVDLRHTDAEKRRELMSAFGEICQSVGSDRGVEVSVTRLKDEEPASMDAALIDVFRGAAESHGASWHRMPSGAGHDSQLMATRLPTAMLFVPSVDGKSHRPDEFTELADCVRGASVLATALYDLAYR
jgi:allantoate deiminase